MRSLMGAAESAAGVGGAKRVWLKAFWGFDPGEEGYLGFTRRADQLRLIDQWLPGDLVLIYGASSAETDAEDRRQALGFLEIDPTPISDRDRMSAIGLQRKLERGWADRWTHAVPVRRAWSVTRRHEIGHIAPDTYTKDVARVIASQGMLLLPHEASGALALPVVPANVFGEEPISPVPEAPMAELFSPSRGFPPTFGERTSEYVDLPNHLYALRLEGNAAAFLGREPYSMTRKVLIKLGHSNSPVDRCADLNCSFPPAAATKWKVWLQSRPFRTGADAKAAEDAAKASFAREFESLGGEFFLADEAKVEAAFGMAASGAAFHLSAVKKLGRGA